MRRLRARLFAIPLGVALVSGVIASAAQLQVESEALTTLDVPVAGATTTTTSPAAPSAVLTYPGDALRGVVTLNATATSGASPIASVAFQRLNANNGAWTSLCQPDTSAPYSCTWDTTAVTDGDHSLRVVATDAAGRTGTSAVVDVVVDNTPPTVTMVDPGTPLRGTVLLSAIAADATSGVASVRIERVAAGGTAWVTACTSTSTSAPYSCYFDTTTLPYGPYDFRAVAADVAGNVATSNLVRNRLVDNTASSVTMLDPGPYLRGTAVPLAATVALPAGVTATSVTIQIAPAGGATWSTACPPDTVAPYGCAWNSTQVTDGLYDFRAVLLDSLGNTRYSTVVTGRRVDNTPLRGFDVQATNGGTAAGLIETGDSFTLTYNDLVDPSSVVADWTGAIRDVVVRVRDGGAVGTGGAGDTLDVFTTTSFGTAVNVGSVNLFGNYVRKGRTLVFNATMRATQVTVNGVPATAVVFQLTSAVNADGTRVAGGTPTMVWTPSAAARDLAGNPCSTAPVTESGTADRDL